MTKEELIHVLKEPNVSSIELKGFFKKEHFLEFFGEEYKNAIITLDKDREEDKTFYFNIGCVITVEERQYALHIYYDAFYGTIICSLY